MWLDIYCSTMGVSVRVVSKEKVQYVVVPSRLVYQLCKAQGPKTPKIIALTGLSGYTDVVRDPKNFKG